MYCCSIKEMEEYFILQGMDFFWGVDHIFTKNTPDISRGKCHTGTWGYGRAYKVRVSYTVRVKVSPFLFYFFPCHLLSSPVYSLSLLAVTQILGHIAGSCPTFSLRFVPCILSREEFSSSFVDSRTIVPTHARRSQQLILFHSCKKKFKISTRRDSNSVTNTIHSSIRG